MIVAQYPDTEAPADEEVVQRLIDNGTADLVQFNRKGRPFAVHAAEFIKPGDRVVPSRGIRLKFQEAVVVATDYRHGGTDPAITVRTPDGGVYYVNRNKLNKAAKAAAREINRTGAKGEL